MKIRILSLLMFAATSSMADLSIPYNQVAKDSSEVQAAYNAKAASNAETSTRLSSDGTSLTLDVTWGHSVGKEYGANAAILQPLNSSWKPKDFTGVTAVSFEYKTDAKTTAEFSLSSPLYKGDASNSGVMMLAELAAATSWKTKIISLPDGIGFLKWMTVADTKNGTSYASQSWDDVKSQVKALQFSPKPNYTSATALDLPATTSMSIRNLKLIDLVDIAVDELGANGRGCVGRSDLLADFNNSNPKQNYQGGWWYAFTDTTSGPVGLANGTSALVTTDESVAGMSFIPGDGNVGGISGYVGIVADLNKIVDGIYRPYAGWAAIGTGFKGPDGDIALDLCPNLSISFDVVMGGDEGMQFDSANLGGVDFKVGKASVPDSLAWHIGIPSSMNNRNICVDASVLKQPEWYTSKLATVPTFTANDITKLLWEIKIQNQDAILKATTPTSSKRNGFWVGDVRVWNAINCHDGISSRKVGGKASLVANYANGLVLSYALEGAASAKVDVVRMDGSKVASFDAPASASSRSFSMNLARGSYLAVVKGGKASLVAPFAVAK